MRSFLIVACFLLLIHESLPGQNISVKENDSISIPTDEQVKIGTLENGLKYYIRENKKPENRAELRLVVKAGSILEDEDQLGLAHFMEHMAFNGTENFAKNDLVSYLQSIGVKFGADLNAYTSFDETVYILPVPTDDEKILNQSFQILEDWAHRVTLAPADIDSERGVVIEEWRNGRGAAQRMRDETFPVLLKGSKYAQRLPIGTLESLESFDHAALQRFYQDWYRPSLMAVIAVGDFDAREIEKKIKTHFASLQNPENERERKQFGLPDHDETLVTIATDEEATFSTVGLYIKTDKEQEIFLHDYYNSLLHIFYTGMLNQRLQEIAQQPDAPFISAGTSYRNFLGDKNAFTAMANVREGGISEGLEGVLTETERVRRFGFTAPELERFKKDFLSYFEKSYNERDKSQSRNYAQEYIRNFLDNEPIPGIEFEYHFANEHIPTIALEEINALSQKFFKEGNRVIVVNAPKKEDVILPTKDELLDVLSLVQQKHISPYIDDMAGQKLMEELPESGSIVSEEQIEQIDVTEITLNNGVKVILKPTDFKNDEIVMTAWSEGGSSLYDLDDYQSAANADAVVNECGVAGYSPSDLQKLLAGKTANARPYIGTLGEGLNGSCTPKDMETMFQLTHLYFTKPNKSKDLFEAYIDKSKALYKNLLSNPTYYFYNESAKVMSQNHPRGGQFPTEEDWDKINFDRTFEIYNERFQNAADFTFVIVGNFSLDSIKPYLARYLGSLPASDRQESWRDLGIRPPGGVVKKDFRKGADPKSSVSIRFHGEYQYDRKTNHQISSLTDLMDILLIEKIREEKGGVYGISARPSTSKDPFENYMISINFPCKPENSDTLTNAVFEVIHSIKHDGVDTAPVNKVKETQTREMEVKIKENGYWVSALKYSYEHGYDPIEIVNYQEKIDSLTPEILQKTALKYLNEKSYVYLRLLPQE